MGLAMALNKVDVLVDPCLVRAAGLVHDIAKGQPHHAGAGAALLREFGFPGVADVVARHMTIDFDGRSIDEGAVLYLADKLIKGEKRVLLEERFAPAFTRFADDAGALASVLRRFTDARAIQSAVESRVGTLDLRQAGPVTNTEMGGQA